jgi:hypothetical protein
MAKRIEKIVKANAIEEKTAIIDLSKLSDDDLRKELLKRYAIKEAIQKQAETDKMIAEQRQKELEEKQYKEALQTVIRLQDKFESKASVHTEAKTDTQANMIDSLLAESKTISEIAESLIAAGYFNKVSKAKARVNRRIAALKIRESRA